MFRRKLRTYGQVLDAKFSFINHAPTDRRSGCAVGSTPLRVAYNQQGEVEGVKYDRLCVAFVNAFKEQQAQIKQLQQQLEALKKLVCADRPEAAACK